MTRQRMFSGQKIALLLVGIFIYTFAHAIPARRGIWRHITLADGTEVTAELRGDEHGRFWMDREGNAYMENELGTLVKMTKEEALATLAQNRQQLESSKVGSPMKAPRRVNGIPTDKSIFSYYVYTSTFDMVTTDYKSLEAVGVTPDIVVPYDAQALADGKDPQLEAALRYLRSNN